MRKNGFTLVEVLITVGIIGVVAALTIPTIMQNSNSKKFASQFKKTLSTLSQAAIMSQAQYDSDYSSLNTASSSESCAEESLAKSNLTMCGLLNSTLSGHTFLGMYGTVKGANAWSTYTVTRESLPKSALSEDTMIFALSDGSFVGFNKNATRCGLTPGTPINVNTLGTALATCIGFIDVNGPNPPNKEITCKDSNANNSGATCPPENTTGDVFPVVFHDATFEPLTLNEEILAQANLAHRRDFSKWEAKTISKGLSESECNAVKDELGIKNCGGVEEDYWAAAVKMCGGVQNMPTEDDLTALAETIYDDCSGTSNRAPSCTGFDASKVPENLSGLGSSWERLWSGSEYNSQYAFYRRFSYSSSDRSSNSSTWKRHNNKNFRVVCVGDL